jgi:hypothetical protein
MKKILPFKELYAFENNSFENYIDLIYDDNKVYKRLYIKYNNINNEQMNQLINVLTIEENFILDKSYKDRIELIDTKTGNIRYYIWFDGSIEIHRQDFLGFKNK